MTSSRASRVRAGVLVFGLLFGSFAGSGSAAGRLAAEGGLKDHEGHGVISRTWMRDERSYQTEIQVHIPRSKGDAGVEVAGYATLTVRLDIQGGAALRRGEEEHFSVAAVHANSGAEGRFLMVSLRPNRSVWYYRDPGATVPFERKVPIYGSGGTASCQFALAPIRRRVVETPNTIATLGVFKPSQDDRVTLSFLDKGNPGELATRLKFEVWQVRFLWWDKKIAEGVVDVGAEGLATVDLTPGGDGMLGPELWFGNRKAYRISFAMQRISDEYRDRFGPDEDHTFSFQTGGFRLEEKTEFGEDLDDTLTPPGEAAPADRLLTRQHRFLEHAARHR